ncbi:hypothetical protein GCM10020358_43350 [Amorphoplanes nipponensis]
MPWLGPSQRAAGAPALVQLCCLDTGRWMMQIVQGVTDPSRFDVVVSCARQVDGRASVRVLATVRAVTCRGSSGATPEVVDYVVICAAATDLLCRTSRLQADRRALR